MPPVKRCRQQVCLGKRCQRQPSAHWRIQGSATSAHPPQGSNSFVFAYVFAKKCPHQRLALADLGGVPSACPPMGPNSFIFTYIFTKKCPCWRSMPPLTGAHPPLREILDLPLVGTPPQWEILDLLLLQPTIYVYEQD